MEMVGKAYLTGHGVARDATLARAWLEKAAAAGLCEAASDLANLHETGTGVPLDDTLALSWHRKAAALGCDEATIALALRAQAAGETRSLNRRSTHWLALTTDETRWSAGSGLQTSAADNSEATWNALSTLTEALEGEPLRQYETGIRYLSGDGVTRDKALGDAWLQRAQASFAAKPGLRAYADATRVVEQRVGASLTAAEKERAQQLARHLIATVPASLTGLETH